MTNLGDLLMKNTVITEDVIQQHIDKTDHCIIRSEILTGFGVRIYPSGKASYIGEPIVQRSTKRNVIGKFPSLSVDDERELAREEIRHFTAIPPTSSTSSPATIPSSTLSEAYDDYNHQIQLKPSTISMYDVVFRCYLSHLHETPLDQISKQMVINLHLENC